MFGTLTDLTAVVPTFSELISTEFTAQKCLKVSRGRVKQIQNSSLLTSIIRKVLINH